MTAPADPLTCALEEGCPAPATARVAVARHRGTVAYLTVVPAFTGRGGIPSCADHVATTVDRMLMVALPPASPPKLEQGGPA